MYMYISFIVSSVLLFITLSLQGQMEVTPPAFSHLVHMLRSLANGRLAVILEGGYHMEALTESVAYTVRGLLDDPLPQLDVTAKPQPEYVHVC